MLTLVEPLAAEYQRLWTRARLLASDFTAAGLPAALVLAQIDLDYQPAMLAALDHCEAIEDIGLTPDQQASMQALVGAREALCQQIEDLSPDPVMHVLVCVMIGAAEPAQQTALLRRDVADDIAEAARLGYLDLGGETA